MESDSDFDQHERKPECDEDCRNRRDDSDAHDGTSSMPTVKVKLRNISPTGNLDSEGDNANFLHEAYEGLLEMNLQLEVQIEQIEEEISELREQGITEE